MNPEDDPKGLLQAILSGYRRIRENPVGDIAMGFTPAGVVADVEDAGRAIRDRDLVGLGLAGIGFVPGVGDVAKGAGKAIRRAASDLPMDEASRLARARELGFDVDRPLYHGSSADIADFEARSAGKDMQMSIPGVHLAENPEFASLYAQAPGSSVYDVFARPGKQLDATKLVEEGTEEAEIVNALYRGTGRRPYWSSADIEGTGPKVTSPLSQAIDLNPEMAIKELRDRGYNSVLYEAQMGTATPYGMIQGERSPTLLVLDPKDIRSRRAAFDPAQRESANLLAGLAGLFGAGTAARMMNQNREER